MPYPMNVPALFRGGAELIPRLGIDVLIDRMTGLLRTDRGISLFDSPSKVMATQVCTKVVFPDGFDDRAALEMAAKGWASVRVETSDGKCYPVYFSDPVRLQQDLEMEVNLGRHFLAEPGLIVLPEVTVEAIHEAVHALFEQGFFAHLQPKTANGNGA